MGWLLVVGGWLLVIGDQENKCRIMN